MHKAKKVRALMSRKFYTMLFGGTLSVMVVAVLLMVDSIIAGAIIGADAVSGITLVTPLYFMSAFFGSIFSLGVPIIYSADMGRFKKKEADKVFGFGLLMSLLLGVVLLLVTIFFSDNYIFSHNPTDAVAEQAREYVVWMKFAFLCLPLQMLMSGIVYADGDERISVLASIVQGGGNLAGVIVLGYFMGIRGIGLASFVSTALSLVVLCLHLFKKSNSLHINLYFSFRLLFKVLRYSIIDAGSFLFIAAFTAAMNIFISAHFGAEYLILVSVISLGREFEMVFDGVGEAITPIISVYLGEECYPGVKRIYKLALKTAIIEGLAVTLLQIAFAPFIPTVLGITDAALAEISTYGLIISAVGSTFISLLYLLTSYYLLIDKIALGLLVSALRDVLAAVPLFILLGSIFGVYGFFAGLMLAPIVSWLGTVLYLRIRYGKSAPLLLRDRERGKDSLIFDLMLNPDSVVEVRDKIGEALDKHGYDRRTVNRAMLLFEELFMLLIEKNGEGKYYGECVLQLGRKSIRMITRDTGVKFDLADSDMEVMSLRSYVVSNVAESISNQKQHLVTMSLNRNAFELAAQRVEQIPETAGK